MLVITNLDARPHARILAFTDPQPDRVRVTSWANPAVMWLMIAASSGWFVAPVEATIVVVRIVAGAGASDRWCVATTRVVPIPWLTLTTVQAMARIVARLGDEALRKKRVDYKQIRVRARSHTVIEFSGVRDICALICFSNSQFGC